MWKPLLALPLAAALFDGTNSPPAVLPRTAAHTAALPVPTQLQVHFLDVGTGDCIWIRTGDDGIAHNGQLEGYNIVIDGGDAPSFGRVDGYKAASAYLQEDDRLPVGSTIHWLICTHPHSDHCGGLDNFLDDYEVLNILDPGHDPVNEDGVPASQRPDSIYGRFFAKAATEQVNGQLSRFLFGLPDNLAINVGSELRAEILHSSRTILDGDLNNTSIVLSLRYTDPAKPVSFLFMGDAEEAVEDLLVAELGEALRATVLKAGHHGSKSSTTEGFLQQVKPAHVVISSGNQKFSGSMLPAVESLARIEEISTQLQLGTKIWRTDRGDKEPVVPVGQEAGDDTVVAQTDGVSLTIGYLADGSATPGVVAQARCAAITLAGTQCSRKPKDGSAFCWQHQP